MPGGVQNKTKKNKFKKKMIQYDCKRCKPTNDDLKRINKEQFPCNECRQNLEIQVTGDNNCYSNLDDAEEPWYVRAILSGISAPPKLKNIFKKKIIQEATIAQCKGNVFFDSCLKDIQQNSRSQKSEEINDPCNPPKKQNSEKSSKTGCCKCPPANTKGTAKKCIGHSLIEDDNQSKSPRKNSKTPANNKTPNCKNKPMTKWISNNVAEDCQGGAERVVNCTPLDEEELEASTFKSRNVKKSKRKKRIPKKLPRACDCIEDENNKIKVQKQRNRC